MNKQCFRVIFNKTLQCFVVVSELAKVEGKSAEGKEKFTLSRYPYFAALCPLTFSLFCALGLVSLPILVQAETLIIRADESAPKNQQPIILQTANGIPQVNIQTPNDKGLSHNKYSKFDVDTKGAILNNSRKNTSTQQAGWVQGNPYLAKGEAKVILNEVNSNDPSLLKGYVEVAGQKADVIIANPSGIHCSGCGVINSDRATFSTGKPQIQKGNLEGFVVEKGKVQVDGKGLDNSRVDYTEILSREVKANAGIWSKKEVDVVTGKNKVKRLTPESSNGNGASTQAGALQIIHTEQTDSNETAPQFAVDVSELGGMYAGKIHLIGTEKGLGVRNAGHIGASSHSLQIDSQGRIINTSIINSQQELRLNAAQGIENQSKGKIENRQGNIQLSTQANIQQNGAIVARQGNIRKQAEKGITQQGETLAQGNIHYSAPTIEATRSSLIAAGVNVQDSAQGEVRRLEERTAQGKMIQIVARDQVMLHGKNLASGELSVHTENLNLNHSQNYAYNINVEARTGDINVDFARLEAKEKLIFKTPKRLSTESSYLSAMHIETNQQTLYAKDAVWKQTGTADLRLNAENISTLGAVFTTQGDFFIEGGKLENRQGTLHSGKSLRLTLQDDIISTKGQLFANEHIAIQANNLSNDDGIIYANQNISVVNKGVLNNRKGILVSKAGNLAINTHGNHIQNSMGKIVAAQKLNVQSETLDNREGVISAGHNIIHAKHIDNRAISDKGSVISGETLILNVTQLDNQQTKAKGALPQRGIQGVNLNINTATLNNQQGGVYAQKLADIRSDFRFNNQQGELLSADAMVISHQNNLMINNQEGMIQGKNRIALEAKGIESEGSIQTAGDLMISIKESFSLNKAFEVGNNLIFKTAGNFENNVIQRVGNKAILSAHEIINHKDAEVSANETQFTSQILTNRGLIDGYKTDINSANLRNIGTGKIYGNYLTIQSAHLQNLAESVNGQSHSATIAAREKLQLAVGTLTNRNHALILSLGDLVIGGQVNDQGNVIGNATLVDNGSATIEALGKGNINTSALINQNLNFSTKQVELPTTYHKEYATSQSGERLSGGRYDRRSSAKNQSYASYYTKEGKRIDSRDWFIWDYRIESNKSEIEQTDPAKILIGGDATFIGSLENDKSQIIIGGRLSAESSEIHNKDAEGVISSIHLGQFTHSYVKKRIYRRKKRPRRFESSRDYKAPQPDQTFQLGAWSLLENANVADYASGLKIGSQETASNIKVEPVEINPQALNSTHLSSTNKDKNVSINSAVINGGISGIKTHPVDAKLPQASLYRINPDNPQGYLIETDPKFTQRKQWLSSDYMFEQLCYEHDRTHKRLGDGFYEQRLVNEQINQLTGRRFLTGYSNDREQYKALMNSGVKYAKQFNLTLGVELTAEQMSELTSDMVWLVNKEVTLPTGQKITVLTPQVYLVARNTDIRTSGALISANEIIANVGDLTNSGIIAGRDLNHIHTKQLENLGIVLGKTVDLSAKQNLINLGGRIEAVDSLLLDAGKKLEIASRQSHAKSAEGNFERQIVDRVGTVKVTSDKGILQLQSREGLTLKGALLDSQGILKAEAKTVSITTLKNQNKEHYSINRDNYYHLEQKNEVGSQLKGKADVVIVGEDNVNIRQGQILSEAGALKIAALKGNVKIETGRDEEHFASSVKTTSKGLLSKSTNISQHKHEINSAVESSLQGDSVMLYAGDTLTDEGSTIKAKQNIHLEGQERVYLNAAQSKRREHHYVASKKSGFSASFSQGSARIGIGRSEQQERDTEYQIEHQGSQLSTQYGNIAVLSNLGNVTANATKFESGKDILVEGKQIHFNAKIDQTDNVYSYSSNSKGFGIGLVYNPAAVFKSRYGEQSSQGSAGSLVGKSVTAGEAFDKTFQQVLNGASPYLTANKKQREGFAHTEKANVVEMNARGNLAARATEGDITSQGSHLTAQGDGTLQAKGNVDSGVASTEQTQTNRHKQKGIDIDLSRRFTEVVGAYHSKEKGDGSLTKEQASVLSFGGKGSITAEKGNVTLAGTQAVSHNDMIIWAGKDVRITTANTLRAQNESSTAHGIGEAVVSETERFSGYNRKLSSQEGKGINHQGSTVASLNGSVDIYAGKDFHQTSGQVLAKDKIKVSAESVTIDSAHNTQHHRSHASDLKVGQFTRVISPIIDLVNALENTVKNKEASDRVKAAQLMGLAAQGYTLKNTAESVLNNDDKAVLFRVESGVGLSHSRQNQTGESRES
ncbi:filamentous hemagglutinin N-terminal domain-containing protein, partial [[Haemophilus] felis]|nr:filamentous hemagglutinin N-terminal domain-containing protein [[Haemophilus] felis]